MASVDMRSRTDRDIRTIDPFAFFEDELPQLARERIDLVVAGARELKLRPFAFAVDGCTATLAFDGDRVTIAPGDEDAAAVWKLDRDGFGDLVNDTRTPMAFFTGGELDMPRGGLDDALNWWCVLRSLVDGRAIHATGAVTFDVDLGRRFSLDDDRDEMANHMIDAGFLHIAGVFTQSEMDAVFHEIDESLPDYSPDDGHSWWARTAKGEHRAVRLDAFDEHSPTTHRIIRDGRLDVIRDLFDDGHQSGDRELRGNVIEALIKPVGVIEGISDVPWHKDCSLGRHSYRCCAMTIGISVTGADATCGQLRVVAGSHRALIQPAFVRKQLDLPQIDLPTETGDVTVHLSCTMHMSEPPVERERRVMYTGFGLPDPDHDSRIGDAKLRAIRNRAYKTVSQEPGHIA
jgi:hypothetical protein